MSFRPVLERDALWSGEMIGVDVDGCRVLVLDRDGEVHAYADRCAHKGLPLSDGRLEAGTLVCGVHGWCYDASTGCGVNPPSARLVRYLVKVEDGLILVDTTRREIVTGDQAR